jgi:hypothetical protein
MGGYVRDTTTVELIYQLSFRFRLGGHLEEMVVIQQEFEVFSEKYSLQQAFRILNIVPGDFNERRLWFKYLDDLRKVPSDLPGVTGHDRIVKAYQENLESRVPMPMHTTTHDATADERVTVTHSRPFVYENQEYIVISYPTKPLETSGRSPAAIARRQRAEGRKTPARKTARKKRAG